MSETKKSKASNQNTNQSVLKIIKGGKYPKTRKDIAVENLWLFCHAALWNTQLFTNEEIEEFKTLLSGHFKGQRNIDKTFKQLVERVCLAKRYIARKSGRYISKPVDWLNINYKNGLAGTAGWYKIVEEQRVTVPHYNEGISALANAVFNFCEKPSLKELHHSRIQLIRLKQHDLLQTYMNTIIHIKYFAACVDFAGYLARNHGKVLYIAREEGLDRTLQDKLNATDVAHPNLDIAKEIPENLAPYDFIFFDSVNKLGLSAQDLEALKQANPGKSFVYIFQTTKEGNFRGGNEFQHDVDVVIEVPEKGLAVQNGRFNQGGEMQIFEEQEHQEVA